MDADSRTETIFGGFDGTVSAIGVIAPLTLAGQRVAASAIVVAAVGLAINSGWSMGSGQYISDPRNRIHLALVMGLATLVFSFLPAAPFLLGGPRILDGIGSLLITLLVGVLIAELRPGARTPSYRLTFSVLLVGIGLGTTWGLLAPN